MTQHHSPLPQPSANHSGPGCLQPQPWPSPGPSFKGLLRSLLLTHPKPSALFSKKASVLPLNLFSWSAASLATIAVLSFDAPAFGHTIRSFARIIDEYRSSLSPNDKASPLPSSLSYDEVRECTEGMLATTRIIPYTKVYTQQDGTYHTSDKTFIPTTYYISNGDFWLRAYGISLYKIDRGGDYFRDVHGLWCHFHKEEENKPPTTTGSIPDQRLLSVGGTLLDRCNAERDTRFSTDLSSLFNDPDGDNLTYEVTGERPWIRASISGSTLNLNALEEAVTGDSTTITVTASDGKDDGDASLSFNVNIVAEETPKPILSINAITFILREVPPDQPTPIAQDSYSVTLSCQYRFPVTVEISGAPGSLEIGPTALTFNQTNWDVPQTVRVKTVGTTSGSFTLPHTAVTTTSEGKTVRESDNLRITVTYEEIENEMDDTQDTIEDNTPTDDQTQDQTDDTIEDNTDDDIVIEPGESALEAYTKDVVDEFARRAEKEIKTIAIGAAIGSVVPGVGTAGGAGIGVIINKLDTAWEVGEVIGDFLLNNNEIIDSGEEFNRLAENLYIHYEALQNGTVSLDQAFSGQTFSFPFNLSQASTEDQESSTRRFNALISSEINFSRISDSTPNLDFDGSATFYGLGLSVIPNSEVPLLTNLQFGYTRSNSDFNYQGTAEGTYKLQMFSVHPSIAWKATDSLTLWTTLGYGRPNTETVINSIDGSDLDLSEEVSYSSSGDFFNFAGGANYRVWQSDLSALSLNLSGSTTSFLDNDSKEGSLSAQFSHKFPFDAGQLQTSADLALILSDSGPSATELSGNLNWFPNKGRLSGSTNARVLLFGGDRSEWGIGGSVTLLPNERGEGLSLALRPSFGQTTTALSNLHLDPFSFSDPTELAISTAPLTARFNAELAYGFPRGNHALLTPYTKLSMGHYGTTTSAGLRYQLDTSLDLDLSASQRQRSSGNNDNRFFLQLRSDL